MRVLCVAEKNSISKNVSQILSKNSYQMENTQNKYIKNYKFTFNFPRWGGDCEVTMTAAAGHITKKEIPSSNGWNNSPTISVFDCSLETIYTDNDGAEKIANNIQSLARNADMLMIWTDCDREGEFIGWEIVKYAQRGNPRFNLDTAFRAKFSHLEPNHIRQAAINPIKLDKLAIDAVDVRSELDLRTGVAFTRILTKGLQDTIRRLNSRNDGNKNDKSIISYGPCQFPTLGFVVDRHLRIKNFKAESFWYIDLKVKKGHSKYNFTWDRGRLFDRLYVVSLYQDCILQNSSTVTVKELFTKPKSKYAPLPLTTVELQKDCSKYFKISAKDSLNIAENLYTKGLISYPRTETDSFPRNMDFKHLISQQRESSEWGEYANSLLNDPTKFRIPRRGKHDDEAHPPIHPVTFQSNLVGKEKTIYEYVVRRFLAACSLDATGSMTNMTVQWGDEIFKANGLVVLERNYLEVYKWDHWDSTKNTVPNANIGEKLSIVSAVVNSGETSPPQPLTETELIALMDVNGIGTDATIADHIEKIITREYITKEKKKDGRSYKETLHPTILGYSLSVGFSQLGLDNISLTKPFLRGDMEKDLNGICNGTKQKGQVLENTLKVYKEAFKVTERKMPILIKAYKDSWNYTHNDN
ncbi:DNA topoisomerase [Pichia californica]|uniref:DNA topoisomerase n=1 Tax=Pichia californica TaxID=460514 RepID=A0A9P7BGH7_9ASCO|nr:DNA topoisomerase [[Candida] californica]KAG0688759.1 DNA topoisomerase [[Candida] californica]